MNGMKIARKILLANESAVSQEWLVYPNANLSCFYTGTGEESIGSNAGKPCNIEGTAYQMPVAFVSEGLILIRKNGAVWSMKFMLYIA